MTKTYGLIGKKLGHSFSPAYFEKKFELLGLDADYHLFELAKIEHLPELILKTANLHGLNVTVPYKAEVLPFLDELDVVARKTRSVNTIQISWKKDKYHLKGFNTDVIGFEQSLLPVIQNHVDIKSLLLGTGGSASSVACVLKKWGIEFMQVSRNPQHKKQITYQQITKEILEEHKLIVQATPLGMFPNIEESPAIPFELLSKDHILFDLIYNPLETKFLKLGKLYGTQTMNGLRMLEIQADAAWDIWNEKSPSVTIETSN